MENKSTERAVCCPICSNRLFSTCSNADITIKCGRCNSQLRAQVISGSVTVDVIPRADGRRTA